MYVLYQKNIFSSTVWVLDVGGSLDYSVYRGNLARHQYCVKVCKRVSKASKTIIKAIWDQSRMVLREIELKICGQKIVSILCIYIFLDKKPLYFSYLDLTSTDCFCWLLHLETCWCWDSPASPDYLHTCHWKKNNINEQFWKQPI